MTVTEVLLAATLFISVRGGCYEGCVRGGQQLHDYPQVELWNCPHPDDLRLQGYMYDSDGDDSSDRDGFPHNRIARTLGCFYPGDTEITIIDDSDSMGHCDFCTKLKRGLRPKDRPRDPCTTVTTPSSRATVPTGSPLPDTTAAPSSSTVPKTIPFACPSTAGFPAGAVVGVAITMFLLGMALMGSLVFFCGIQDICARQCNRPSSKTASPGNDVDVFDVSPSDAVVLADINMHMNDPVYREGTSANGPAPTDRVTTSHTYESLGQDRPEERPYIALTGPQGQEETHSGGATLDHQYFVLQPDVEISREEDRDITDHEYSVLEPGHGTATPHKCGNDNDRDKPSSHHYFILEPGASDFPRTGNRHRTDNENFASEPEHTTTAHGNGKDSGQNKLDHEYFVLERNASDLT